MKGRLCECSGMTPDVERLLAGVTRRSPSDPGALDDLIARAEVALPDDYLGFMRASDGGEGDVGERWVEIWPVARVLGQLDAPPHYEGVVLFAGDGANTVFGFDRFRDGQIVEGDWIGLNRDELILHGATFTDFLQSLASQT